MTEFTHFELKALRHKLGLSLSEMAAQLGLSGGNASDVVRAMENGGKPISGPIQCLCRYIQQGELSLLSENVLPKFLIADGCGESGSIEYLLHTRFPRFIAAILPEPITSLDSIILVPGEHLNVVMWIDQPVKQVRGLLIEAAKSVNDYTGK